MQIRIDEIKVSPERGEVAREDVQELADSIREVGLLTAITVDSEYNLIAGLHRLEAVKLLGEEFIECVVSDLKGLQAELAEIDENIVRRNISVVDYGELLLRRKRIYEELHPETKHGGDRKSQKIKIANCNLDSAKSFVQDTADKTGVNPATISRYLQAAKNMTADAKAILKDSNAEITQQTALQLSRLQPEEQKEAAALLARGEIKTVDEFYERKDEPEPDNRIRGKPLVVPLPPEGKRFGSFEESVADLKNPDKDASCTPNGFLTEVTGFVERYLDTIVCYHMERYQAVYAELSDSQMDYLRGQMDRARDASEKLYQTVERKRNDELRKRETPA